MEGDKDQGQVGSLYYLLGAVALVAVLYFGLFGAILLDEAVFKTFFFSRHSPDWLSDFIKFIYRPLTAPFH